MTSSNKLGKALQELNDCLDSTIALKKASLGEESRCGVESFGDSTLYIQTWIEGRLKEGIEIIQKEYDDIVKPKRKFELLGLDGLYYAQDRKEWKKKFFWCVEELFGYVPDLNVSLRFKENGMGTSSGHHQCIVDKHIICVHKYGSDKLNTLFHEIVHLWQTSTGRLNWYFSFDRKDSRNIKVFDGQEYDLGKVKYEDLPWEIEAREKADELSEKWNLESGKRLKSLEDEYGMEVIVGKTK